MRLMIANAAKKHQLDYFIACFNRVHCQTYDPPQGRQISLHAIYGGHLYWPGVEKGLAASENKGGPHVGSDTNFSCFTGFREPVSRVLSCWFYRRFTAFSGNLSKVPLDKFRDFLQYGLSEFSEGCNNEPLRLFSDSGRAEEKTNTLSSGTSADPMRDENGWSFDAAGTLIRTLEHVRDHCVVGVLERCEDTKSSVEFFFPWLKGSYNCTVHTNKHKHPSVITEAQTEEIKRQNALEIISYRVANEMLDAQLAVVRQHDAAARSTQTCAARGKGAPHRPLS